jgi:ATP adenylyltransferase
MDCVFCNKAVLERQKLYETNTECVLYNIRKSNRGRCVVVPKRHVSSIRELSDKEIASFFQTVKLVANRLSEDLKPVGFNFGLNEGKKAGQTIEHLHFHIIPRFKDDRLLEFHLFHDNPKIKQNWSEEKYRRLIKEFKKLFKSR